METPISIVGMSCRFAGCNGPAALWDAVMSQKCLLTPPCEGAALPVGAKSVFGRQYPACIGQLGELYACVPSMQNFPRQVNAGENQDLYFATQLAFDALADAGMRPHGNACVRGSVRLGYAPPFNASTVNWLQHTTFLEQTLDIIRTRFYPGASEEAVGLLREKLKESLPKPDAASFLLGGGYRFASWIARECSFSGVATIVDAGNLSGAVTLMDAVEDLRSGRADVALAGALTPPFSHEYLEGLSGEVAFSAEAELRPFDRGGTGTVPGEGGAFFVLKRRADALRDRDRIYANVRSVAVGHNPEDDPSAVLAAAIAAADVPVRSIGLVEADGTGIPAQELREIAALQRLWGEHRPGGPLVGIGSVKGNVGHTLRAAMAAGLAKTALALGRRVLPPQMPCQQAHAAADNISSSVYLLSDARPWISGDSASPRRAVVLGANFDVASPREDEDAAGRAAAIVLEEEPEDRV